MKRVLLTLAATVAGLVALLSYKSHSAVGVAGAGLPSAGVTSAAPTPSAAAGTAPPVPGGTAATSGSATSTAPSAASATYTGKAVETQYGVVQVRITVSGKKITNVAFAQLTAYDGRSERINSDAAPILLQETLAAQSAKIDSVSGASYTSDGYVQSLQSALDQAGL